jgi:hypothetical protein
MQVQGYRLPVAGEYKMQLQVAGYSVTGYQLQGTGEYRMQLTGCKLQLKYKIQLQVVDFMLPGYRLPVAGEYRMQLQVAGYRLQGNTKGRYRVTGCQLPDKREGSM